MLKHTTLESMILTQFAGTTLLLVRDKGPQKRILALGWMSCASFILKGMNSDIKWCHNLHAVVTALCCYIPLTMSQCTLAGSVYTGMQLECHWLPSVHRDTTGWPSEYLQGTLEHHWKNSVETAPHWNDTGESLTFAPYTGTPLDCNSPHTPRYI